METSLSKNFRVGEFENWLCTRFGMQRGSLGAFQIVLSYSLNEEQALEDFFSFSTNLKRVSLKANLAISQANCRNMTWCL